MRSRPQPKLDCFELPGMPKLGWIAVCELQTGRVRAFHGSAVERGRDWLVEGIWDGDFAAGGFHRTGHFFGSGIRVEQDRVSFVPSTSCGDRLFHCQIDDTVVVANSLCLLLAYTGARLDPRHDYRAEVYAIRKGLSAYDSAFRVSHSDLGRVEQLFYHHLVVSHGTITRETPPAPAPGLIQSYDQYVTLLRETLGRMQLNAISFRRRDRLSLFTTASAGYDSPATAALVKGIGVKVCFAARYSNSRFPRWLNRDATIDDGAPIAEALGMRVVPLGPPHARVDDDELYFLAACCSMPSLVFHSMAQYIEHTGRPAVVFTGFQGDYAWDVNIEEKHINSDFTGCDTSGTSFSEIRLKSGFINAPVPYLYARAVGDLVTIGKSVEMAPWRSIAQPDYDRPIARRIAETAGIPRQAFGRRKRAVVEAYDYPVNRTLRYGFFAELRKAGLRPGLARLQAGVNRLRYTYERVVAKVRRRFTGIDKATPRLHWWKHLDLPRLLFIWANGRLADRLATVLLPARELSDRPSVNASTGALVAPHALTPVSSIPASNRENALPPA